MEPLRLNSAPIYIRPQLGAVLVRKGRLTPEQLEQALNERAHPGERLGEIVVRRGWLYEADIAEALAEQYDLPYLDLSGLPTNPAVAMLLDESVARALTAVPVRFVDAATVLVAVADPTDVVVSDELERALNLGVKLVVAERSAIEQVFADVFGQADPLSPPRAVSPVQAAAANRAVQRTSESPTTGSEAERANQVRVSTTQLEVLLDFRLDDQPVAHVALGWGDAAAISSVLWKVLAEPGLSR